MSNIAALRAGQTVDRLLNSPYLHPKAIEELRGDDAASRVIKWLRERFEALEIVFDDEVVMRTNNYIENGLGLQSVSVGVMGGRGLFRKVRPVRSREEWQDPTIGMIASGMLGDGAKTGVATFPVEPGKMERITALSDGLKMKAHYSKDPVTFDESMVVNECLPIAGGGQVVTLLELRNPTHDQIREAVNRGVYACEYLKMPKISNI